MTATMTGSGTNWSGNVVFSAPRVESPHTMAELRDIVTSRRRVRAVGSRHSFNAIADSPDTMVSLADLSTEVVLDTAASRVTVPAGVRFGDVYRTLDEAGLALHNTGSLPHISVVGACATGTHGSGIGNGSLATAVSGVEMMTADGQLVRMDATTHPETFAGSVLALGALGLVTRATLDVQPAYRVRQDVYDGLSFDAFEAHAEEIFAAAYSVSLFTLWRERSFHQVWLKTRLPLAAAGPGRVGDSADTGADSVPAVFYDAIPADGERHMIPGIDALYTTAQQGVPGPWYDRLPHFRLEFTPSAGEEIQTEYFLPREHAVAALRALTPMGERLHEVLLVSELRTVAADELWLSPTYRRDSVAFHFTWTRDQAAVEALLPELEARLEPFEPRPHWGKVFTMDPALVASRTPRLADFRALARSLDPTGRFRNDFTDTYLFS